MDTLPFGFYKHLSEALSRTHVQDLQKCFWSSRFRSWNDHLKAKEEEEQYQAVVFVKCVKDSLLVCPRFSKLDITEWENLDFGSSSVRFKSLVFKDVQDEKEKLAFIPVADVEPTLKRIVSKLCRNCDLIFDSHTGGFSAAVLSHPFLQDFPFKDIKLTFDSTTFEFLKYQVTMHDCARVLKLYDKWPDEAHKMLAQPRRFFKLFSTSDELFHIYVGYNL